MPSQQAGAPLLEVQTLSLERGGRRLFQGLSFKVLPGHLLQIEGSNGAGKASQNEYQTGLASTKIGRASCRERV